MWNRSAEKRSSSVRCRRCRWHCVFASKNERREIYVELPTAIGILDEIYHSFIDSATTRDFGLLITKNDEFFPEEKRDTRHEIRPLEQGVPGYRAPSARSLDAFKPAGAFSASS